MSRTWCPGDLVGTTGRGRRSADLRLVDVDRARLRRGRADGESLPVEKSRRLEHRAATPRSTLRRLRVHGDGRPSRARPRHGGLDQYLHGVREDAVKLGERQADTAFQRRSSRLRRAAASSRSPACSHRLDLRDQRRDSHRRDRSAAVLARDRDRDHPAAASRDRLREPRRPARGSSRQGVLVKRLVTIEDLGNIAVLFTDKTGTLTEGAIAFHERSTRPASASWRRTCCSASCTEAP